jgi:hypothetical protein
MDKLELYRGVSLRPVQILLERSPLIPHTKKPQTRVFP